MARKMLQGSLESQCAFLYDLALDKMKTGNFAGALYALQEVARHNPEYRDVAALVEELRHRKAEQRRLILIGLASGVLFAGVALALGVTHDLIVILAGAVGLACGYIGYTALQSRRSAPPHASPSDSARRLSS